ncbi:RNA recognition domain-containing protein [Loa loa]|uniref:RNA recognition domain-containing protein n=1 Tax=Loa loa TaxID=7209 RepID=A0A1S0U0Y4_LOALO|nr:RNA recognition domain-containing protein [Loa loa]EFO23613.1 RNA recognition domain-containing protein [Loa loa]
MDSITSYFPGAISAFLAKEGSDATVGGKERKRKKETESRNDESVVFSKKCVTKTRRFELPVAEKKLQPKSAGPSGTDYLTSESLLQEPNFRSRYSSLCSDTFTTIKARNKILSTFLSETEMKKREATSEEKTRTVFVGNAPLSSSRKGIKKLFSQFGAVESVRLHCFIAANEKITKKRDIPSGVRSLTFYVKFKNAKSKEAALALNGEKYDGNLLRVDSCCAKRKYNCRTTVFVGNLPYDVSENELIAHFEMSGNVSFVRIVRDSRTGNSKGFAFVAFKDSAAVPLALQLDGSIFKRRPLRTKRVQKKNKVKSQTYQRSLRTVTKQLTGQMQFDRSVKSVSNKNLRKCGKRGVKNSIMT